MNTNENNPSELSGLKISYLPIDSLTPYPRNARTHSKKQIAQIAESIRVFGFTNPILLDSQSSIIAGHGRIEAAKKLGIKEVPTIRLEHLTEDQKRAYIITDNRLAEKAGWDNAILAIELQNLLTINTDFDLTVIGFEMPEIDFIIQDGAKKPNKDDEFEIDHKLPVISKPGDLYQLGNHRIYCGNALEDASYQALMSGDRADLVFTDPPYNVPIHGHVSGNGSVHHQEFAMAVGEMTEAEFTGFLQTAFGHMAKHSLEGSIHFVCMDWRHAGNLLTAGNVAYSELKNICVWNKDNGGMGSLYRSKHEFIFVFKHGKAPHINNVELGKNGRYRTNVWDYPGQNTLHANRDEELAMHPTVKPVAMVADAIMDCSHRNGIVLDPFGGSGTTLIAAERTGRYARLIELEPRYVDVAIRRWQKMTGKQAQNLSSGISFDASKPENQEQTHVS